MGFQQHESICFINLGNQFEPFVSGQGLIRVLFQQTGQLAHVRIAALAAGNTPESVVIETVKSGQIRLKFCGGL